MLQTYGFIGEADMLMVMDMSTGKIEDGQDGGFGAEFGEFRDEVLNAEWLPAETGLQLGLQEIHPVRAGVTEQDADAFLAAIYRSQQ